MRSACLVRTRFILNNFSGIGLGVPGPPGPPLATPLPYVMGHANVLGNRECLVGIPRTTNYTLLVVAIHHFGSRIVLTTL